MVGLKDFLSKYGGAMRNAYTEGSYGFPFTIPKFLRNDPMGRRAIRRSFNIGRQEYNAGRREK